MKYFIEKAHRLGELSPCTWDPLPLCITRHSGHMWCHQATYHLLLRCRTTLLMYISYVCMYMKCIQYVVFIISDLVHVHACTYNDQHIHTMYVFFHYIIYLLNIIPCWLIKMCVQNDAQRTYKSSNVIYVNIHLICQLFIVNQVLVIRLLALTYPG